MNADFSHVKCCLPGIRVFYIVQSLVMKNGSTTITQRRENHEDHLTILQHRQPSRIFMKTHCIFGGISLVSCIMSCSNRTRSLLALYRTQLMRLSRALKEKRAHYYRHDKIILLHDNAQLHVAAPVKTYLDTQMGSSTHPPYSPDIAPSNYHLFRLMTYGLPEQHFTPYEDTKNCIDDWIASKDEAFFRRDKDGKK